MVLLVGILLSFLTILLRMLVIVFERSFIIVSTLVLYLNGFTSTVSNWLLLLVIVFVVLVTICEIFAMLHVRLHQMYLTYGKQRIRNSTNERQD